jgi:hypothetical protein
MGPAGGFGIKETNMPGIHHMTAIRRYIREYKSHFESFFAMFAYYPMAPAVGGQAFQVPAALKSARISGREHEVCRAF